MDPRLFQSRFSTHFNRLTYLGMWSAEMLSTPRAKKLYLLYQIFRVIFLAVMISIQMIDLYLVFGNLRKVTYNFCTSIIVLGITVKLIFMYQKRNQLNELRLNLWQDSLKFSQEDVAIQDLAYTQLKNIRNCLYLAAVVILPIWIISSYFSYKWGPRVLAFAGYLPMSDPMNDSTYVPALMYQAGCGTYVIVLVIETDLAMFSIVMQIEAFYQILMKNILKLNEIYGEEKNDEISEVFRKNTKTEVNECLKKESAQKLIRGLIIRQLEILGYSKNFEQIFSGCMIVQVFTGSFLIVMNGLELSMFLHEMSVKLYFQSMFIIIIMVDIFLICYHLSRLSTESFNVANVAYSTVWYKMDAEVRKSLCMIIIRSQKPPRITAGKLFLMDLTTYLHMLRNIYSWLMLFRELGIK